MRRSFAVAIVLLVAVMAFAQEPAATAPAAAKTLLQYNPQVGAESNSKIVGKLTEIQMNQAVIPNVTGSMEGTVKLTVKSVDAVKGEVTLTTAYTIKAVEFAGQEREPKPVQPADITITRTGKLVKVVREDMAAAETNPMDLMASGGVPIDAVALMAASISFPATPVAVGEQWTLEDKQQVPLLGEATITKTSKLVKVENNIAFIETVEKADVPAFEMPNPLLGGTMKVESASFSAEKVEREFDLAAGMLRKAKGKFAIQMNADLGFGFPSPLAASGEFEWVPVPVEGQAPAATPAPQTGAAPAEKKEAQTGSAPAPGGGGAKVALKEFNLGPVGVGVGAADGVVRLKLDVNLGVLSAIPGVGLWGMLLSAAEVSGGIQAGYAPEKRGQIGLEGGVKVGPWEAEKSGTVDLKAVGRTLADRVRAIIHPRKPQPQGAPQQ